MYNILDIQNVTPQSGVRYLFDANVWLEILESSYKSPHYMKYVKFFDKITSNPKDNIKIVMPSILLSEIINKKMDWAFDEFLAENPKLQNAIFSGEKKRKQCFKEDYRPSEHYRNRYQNIRANITDYHASIELISDNLDSFTCSKLLKKPVLHMEFNDYLLYKIADQCGYTIVTHDGDFAVENIPILTANPKLLNLMKTP